MFTDMRQYLQIGTLALTGRSGCPGPVTTCRDLQDAAEPLDWPLMLMPMDEGESHGLAFEIFRMLHGLVGLLIQA